MECTRQQRGAVLVLKPRGPLADQEAREFGTQLTDASREQFGRVVVDASAVSFVDSVGLETLVDVTDRMAGGGQALKLCGVNPTLREVLELTGVATQFELYEDANSAVRSFM